MSVFGNSYSRYYNLLYKDKDYAGEARYVHELIQKHRPGARTILNLGCGTGRHDFELVKLGYQVTGVDMSEEMLAVANGQLDSAKLSAADLRFIQGDIRTTSLNETYDVVISLFHVMSYQITNSDMQAACATARSHLRPGGLFLFDCWYGPAVLSDPPVVRVKRLEDAEIEVVRIAEPVLHVNENVVEVNYDVMITEKPTRAVQQIKEKHLMRYFFKPELEGYLAENRIRFLQAEEWLTGNPPGTATWGVCFVGNCSA